jgi:hypothetical protein
LNGRNHAFADSFVQLGLLKQSLGEIANAPSAEFQENGTSGHAYPTIINNQSKEGGGERPHLGLRKHKSWPPKAQVLASEKHKSQSRDVGAHNSGSAGAPPQTRS